MCTDDGCDSAAGCTHDANTAACASDGKPCTEDVCATKTCVHNPLANGAACDDGQVCTTSEVCTDGSCTGPVDKDLDGDKAIDNSCSGGTDCDDDDAARFPDNPEICDDIDNNCTGGTDEICDKDGDDYCDVALPMPAGCTPDCTAPDCDLTKCPGTCSKGGGDCNDANGSINPGANEILELINDLSYFDGSRQIDQSWFDVARNGADTLITAYWGSVSGGPNHQLILYAESTDGGASWTRETALHTKQTKGRVAVAANTTGLPLVAYHDPDAGDARLVRRTAAGWVDELVADAGDVGHDIDVEAAPDGTIHLVHYDTGNGDLLHSFGTSGSWSTEIVDGDGDVGQHCNLTMDAAGGLHIAYFDASNSDLRYATDASGSWVATTADSAGAPGLHAAIALDAAGKVHIAHYELIGSDAKYTTNAGGSWASQVIESEGTVGIRPSIALTSGVKVHLVYHSATKGKKRHATNETGAWVLQDHPKSQSGSPPSRALVWGGDDQLRAYSYRQEAIWQSRWSTTWTDTYLDRRVGLPYQDESHVAGPHLDSTGKLRAVAWSGSRRLLAEAVFDPVWRVAMDGYDTNDQWRSMDATLVDDKYHVCGHRSGVGLVYVTQASGSWVETTIDSGASEIGKNCRIRADGAKKLHIIYWDAVNSVYRYATNESGAWVIDVPDSKTATYGTASISVTAAGKVDIVYPSSSFRHATNAAGPWAVQTVDPTPNSGRWPAIARDAAGKLHVVYLTPKSGSNDEGPLLYATSTGGAWTLQVLDDNNNVKVRRTAIAIDAAGKLHITYMRSNDAYYATDRFGQWSRVYLQQAYSPWIYGMDRGNDLAITPDGAVHHIAQHGYGSKYYGRYSYGNGVDDNCDGE